MEGPLPDEQPPAWWPGFRAEWPALADGIRGMRAPAREWDEVRGVLRRLREALRERRYGDVRGAVQQLKAYEPSRTSRPLASGLFGGEAQECPADVGEILNEMVPEIVPGRSPGAADGGAGGDR
ncbi:CATRA system-associated protein [Streptomyces aculeolatus]